MKMENLFDSKGKWNFSEFWRVWALSVSRGEDTWGNMKSQ